MLYGASYSRKWSLNIYRVHIHTRIKYLFSFVFVFININTRYRVSCNEWYNGEREDTAFKNKWKT